MSLPTITISPPVFKDEHCITSGFRIPVNFLRYFLADNLTTRYSADVSNVPPGLAVIPTLSVVLPVAWFLGANVRVREVDSQFYEATPHIKAATQAMFPGIPLRGELLADTVTDYTVAGKRAACMFSGGLDSLATAIRHESESPYLITVWGADLPIERPDIWQTVKRNAVEFGERHSLQNLFIATNLQQVVNVATIGPRFGIDSWWGRVQHGAALLGLCAPLTFTHGISRIYIGSTHTPDYAGVWGSSPAIDENMRWADVRMIHDGVELTRQDKMRLTTQHMRERDPDLQVRVCVDSPTGWNCSVCEKCSRTILELILEGTDPDQHGFKVTPGTFAAIRRSLESVWYLTDNAAYMWRDIIDHIPEDLSGFASDAVEFFKWLGTAEFHTGIVHETPNLRNRIQRATGGSLYWLYRWCKNKLVARVPQKV